MLFLLLLLLLVPILTLSNGDSNGTKVMESETFIFNHELNISEEHAEIRMTGADLEFDQYSKAPTIS